MGGMIHVWPLLVQVLLPLANIRTNVAEGRKSRARYSLRFDLGSWGTGVSSICVDLLEKFGSTG